MEICVTRFNNKTLKENKEFRLNNNIKCIYSTPVKITEKILPDSEIIVIEMNNSKNIIEGFGIIKNKLNYKIKNIIYNDKNYNRYVYKSNLRIDKEDLNINEKGIIKILENLLFKSKGHMKRGQGIQRISEKIKRNNEFSYCRFLNEMIIKRLDLLNDSKEIN